MKIIFFDIDGTLICGGSSLMSESTKEAIRIARANGHICMINTGRTKRLVGENLTGQVEFDGLLLGCGSEIEYRGRRLMHKTFTLEESQAILDAMKKYHVDAILEGSREDYAPRGEEVFSQAFRDMAAEIEERKYDRSFLLGLTFLFPTLTRFKARVGFRNDINDTVATNNFATRTVFCAFE